jgi:hypothetical protein
MNSRLIPWCLAATGFLASLTVFIWQGKLDDSGERVQPQAAVGHRLTPAATDHHELRSSPAPAASEVPENLPTMLTLPLPPATQPEPDPNVQPVPDDEPTVDDLPARPRLVKFAGTIPSRWARGFLVGDP